ncbi:MAG: hypothetical protein WD628_03895, partial [Thermomicrobiales bacterium]
MVRNSPRHTRRRSNIACLALAALLGAVALTACGGPGDDAPGGTVTAAPIPTARTWTSTATPARPAPPSATPAVEPSAATEPEPEPTEASADIGPESFGAEVASLVGEIEGLVEIVVALPDGTILTELNSGEPIEAASLYKLAIMVEVYVERETGELAFDDEIVLDGNYFAEEDSVFG